MPRGVIPVLLVILGCSEIGGRSPQGSAHVRRVVCLTPSSTEVVAAVGALELVVGVDQFSTYPPEVQKLPKVGSFLQPSVEAILALTPDIAVADEVQAQNLEVLKSAGIPTLSIRMHTIDDVRAALSSLGKALAREAGAEAALRRYDEELTAADEHVKRLRGTAHRPRVLFVVDRQPGGLGQIVAAGPGTFLDELLRRAGADNVLADADARYVNLSPEQVVTRAPELIFDGVHGVEPGLARRDWDALASVPAVQRGRVHVVSDPRFFSPSPRLPWALRELADLLWLGAR